jgi:hypothetical protein
MSENNNGLQPNPQAVDTTNEAEFSIGPSSVSAYSRLSYTMWYALGEFVDNSTQSRLNYEGIIDKVLEKEGSPLKIEIDYSPDERSITIRDNSIGMTKDKLIEALKVAYPTKDSRGRSKYGMGLKTAACWIGNKWSVRTAEWSSGEEWTATVDVESIISGDTRIPLHREVVAADEHYTEVKIWELNRSIRRSTEIAIQEYLGSMYRMDLRAGRLILTWRGNPVLLPEEMELAVGLDGDPQRVEIDEEIGGKRVHGWLGVLKTGGRKYGGFSLFQNDRQIVGYPTAWRPTSIFGGVSDEGSNTLISQRLTGELVMDGFDVSHTKDKIVYRGTEEEDLEMKLVEKAQHLRTFALAMRKKDTRNPWSAEKLNQMMEGIKAEFGSEEVKETLDDPMLPAQSVIDESNKRQAEDVNEYDLSWRIETGSGIIVNVIFQSRSENDPHLTLVSESEGTLTVIINQLHPYYSEIETEERTDEIVRQYIYDAVAEYKVMKKLSRQSPSAIRLLKSQLLRAKIDRIISEDDAHREQAYDDLSSSVNN